MKTVLPRLAAPLRTDTPRWSTPKTALFPRAAKPETTPCPENAAFGAVCSWAWGVVLLCPVSRRGPADGVGDGHRSSFGIRAGHSVRNCFRIRFVGGVARFSYKSINFFPKQFPQPALPLRETPAPRTGIRSPPGWSLRVFRLHGGRVTGGWSLREGFVSGGTPIPTFPRSRGKGFVGRGVRGVGCVGVPASAGTTGARDGFPPLGGTGESRLAPTMGAAWEKGFARRGGCVGVPASAGTTGRGAGRVFASRAGAATVVAVGESRLATTMGAAWGVELG